MGLIIEGQAGLEWRKLLPFELGFARQPIRFRELESNCSIISLYKSSPYLLLLIRIIIIIIKND